MNYSFEQICFQVENYSQEGNKEAIIDLLSAYLKSDLNDEERVWSWWHLLTLPPVSS